MKATVIFIQSLQMGVDPSENFRVRWEGVLLPFIREDCYIQKQGCHHQQILSADQVRGKETRSSLIGSVGGLLRQTNWLVHAA
jgi:hypothetical protein